MHPRITTTGKENIYLDSILSPFYDCERFKSFKNYEERSRSTNAVLQHTLMKFYDAKSEVDHPDSF